MDDRWSRREVLELMGLGGVVFASGLAGCGSRSGDFFFLQLSDTHWGYRGDANPDAANTLPKTITAINAAATKPDFVVFTGDLTHTTDDPAERRSRLSQFKELVARLEVKDVRFLPGEHDAAPDHGEAYREAFGELYHAFDHGGIHFVALDNASSPGGNLGDAQLEWLERDLARVAPAVPVVVFAHRPLFDLYPDWEWTTGDGSRAVDLLSKREHVTVFYGHIHQEHHHVTGHIAHHAARSLIFPLPAPGSVPKRAPLAWDPSSADHGLGHRSVHFARGATAREPRADEIPFRGR
jgi:hypothetical protein